MPVAFNQSALPVGPALRNCSAVNFAASSTLILQW